MLNLAATSDLRDACAPREISANAAAPSKAEAGDECAHRVRLTIAKLECRGATWAQESWKLGDQSPDALKSIAASVERQARLGRDRHFSKAQRRGSLVSLSRALETGGVFCRIHFGRWHIRKVGDKEIKVRWIPWGTARKKWFCKISVQERHS